MHANIYYESDVTAQTLEAANIGLRTIALQMPQFGRMTMSTHDIGDSVLRTLVNGQVATDVLSDIVPWSNGGPNLILTARDIGHRSVNYLFGISQFGTGNALISSHRLEDEEVYALTTHELGHAFSLVREDASQYDKVSVFAGHCINTCVMKPVNSKEDMRLAFSTIAHNPACGGFCDNCRSDLRKLTIKSL